MTRLLPALLVAAAVPALVMTSAPAATAVPVPVPALVEAEAVGSPGTSVLPDRAASAHRARVLPPGRSLTVRVSAPAPGSRLVVRLRTTAWAAPAPAVTVDGRRVAGPPLRGRAWRDQVVGAGQPAGTRTVTISNAAGARGPVLLVDRVRFVPQAATAAAPLDDAYEARVVALVDAHRAAAGLPRLAVSRCADRFAQDWSATMARTLAFRHRPSLAPVLRGCRASAVGENIAYGEVTADQMVAMWMRSPGHRANVLSSRFTHIGVGAARTATGRTYGTQQFLRLS